MGEVKMKLCRTKISLIAIPALLYVLLVMGFCFRDFRFISDNEYKLIALMRARDSIKGIDHSGEVPEYLERHQNCCRVTRFSHESFGDIILRMIGWSFTTVEIKFEYKDILKNRGGRHDYVYQLYKISRCGTIVFFAGMDMKASELPVF